MPSVTRRIFFQKTNRDCHRGYKTEEAGRGQNGRWSFKNCSNEFGAAGLLVLSYFIGLHNVWLKGKLVVPGLFLFRVVPENRALMLENDEFFANADK